MPTVSVIIATRNRAKYLARAMRSVQSQSCDDWEVIVVDDGSTDETAAEVGEFLSDRRIHYVYQEPRGVSAARNSGIQSASGEYLAFLDDDDLFLPDKLRGQVGLLEQHSSVGLVAAGHHVVDPDEGLISTDEPWTSHPCLSAELILLGNRFSINSILVHREWWDRIGGFDETLSLAEDWDAWLRLSLAGCQMRWIHQVVCSVRRHRCHSSSDIERMREAERRVLQKVFARSGIPERVARLQPAAMSRLYFRSALRHYAAGALEPAGNDLEQAIQLDPHVHENEAQLFVAAVASRVSSPGVACPGVCVTQTFSALPKSAAALREHRAEVMAHAALQRMFAAYRNGHWTAAQRSAIEALNLVPAYVRNRGVIKIALLSTVHRLAR